MPALLWEYHNSPYAGRLGISKTLHNLCKGHSVGKVCAQVSALVYNVNAVHVLPLNLLACFNLCMSPNIQQTGSQVTSLLVVLRPRPALMQVDCLSCLLTKD